MKESIQVKPLRKYPTPDYPSHEDPNPLESKHTPQGSKVSFYLSALFSAAGLLAFKSDKKPNPIKFEDLGFPHHYAAFGTGLPQRMDREMAVEAIDRVFKENKIELIKNFPFQNKEGKFTLTAFNPNQKIGYVWLENRNTDPDCYASWRPMIPEDMLLARDQKVLEELRADIEDPNELFKEEQRFMNSLKMNNYYELIRIANHTYYDEHLQNRILKYLKDHPNHEDENYGQEMIDEYDKCNLDLKEIKEITLDEEHTIAAFSTYGEYAAYRSWMGDTEEKAIEKLENLVQDYIDWAKEEGRL